MLRIPAGAYRFKVRAIGEEGPDLTPVERAVQVIAPATAIEKVPQRDDLERS